MWTSAATNTWILDSLVVECAYMHACYISECLSSCHCTTPQSCILCFIRLYKLMYSTWHSWIYWCSLRAVLSFRQRAKKVFVLSWRLCSSAVQNVIMQYICVHIRIYIHVHAPLFTLHVHTFVYTPRTTIYHPTSIYVPSFSPPKHYTACYKFSKGNMQIVIREPPCT